MRFRSELVLADSHFSSDYLLNTKGTWMVVYGYGKKTLKADQSHAKICSINEFVPAPFPTTRRFEMMSFSKGINISLSDIEFAMETKGALLEFRGTAFRIIKPLTITLYKSIELLFPCLYLITIKWVGIYYLVLP